MAQLLFSRRDFAHIALRVCVYGGVLGGAINLPRRARGDTTSDALGLWALDSLEYETVEAAAIILLAAEVAREAHVARVFATPGVSGSIVPTRH